MSTNKLCMSFKDSKGKIISSVIENDKGHADYGVEIIWDFLQKNNIKLPNIQEIWFTNGPGSSIGVSSLLLILKVINLINKNIEYFVTDSLLLQSLFNKNIGSTINISKNNYYSLKDNNYYFNKNYFLNNSNYANISSILKKILFDSKYIFKKVKNINCIEPFTYEK